MKLAIVDKAFIPSGQNSGTVLQNLVRSAQAAEALGFHRYWLTEHHNTVCSYTAPDLMTAVVAGATTRIRVGSAGMLMLFHSPWYVAERFRLLEALFPGRIDLGVAGGTAGSPEIQRVLSPGFDLETAKRNNLYAAQVKRLIELNGYVPAPTFSWMQPRPRFDAAPHVDGPSPSDRTGPPVILLGSGAGTGNAMLAAEQGRAFCYLVSSAHARQGLDVVRRYREHFRPSHDLSEPHVITAAHFLCAATAPEAGRLLNRFWSMFGRESAYIIGSPERCREKIQETLDEYGSDEIALFPLYLSFGEFYEGLQLIAEACRAPSRDTVTV